MWGVYPCGGVGVKKILAGWRLSRKTEGYSSEKAVFMGRGERQLMRDSPENSPAIFIRGGEPWLMGYCWRTPMLGFTGPAIIVESIGGK